MEIAALSLLAKKMVGFSCFEQNSIEDYQSRYGGSIVIALIITMQCPGCQ